jgi:UDP-N-acetylglucosamine kinase
MCRSVTARRNLVVDGTLRNPENVRELAARLRDRGYEVEARVMAVSKETSITRARLRFEEQVSARGTGRFVNQGQHDDAYAGIPRSVALLEQEKLVDQIRLFDAHQRPVYDNVLDRGQWRAQPDAAATLERERDRPWTRAERADYVSVLETIADLAKQRLQVPDAAIEERLAGARADLARFERSPAYLRADAFDQLPMNAALAKHPELDGAFAHLREAMSRLRPETSQDEREYHYFSTRAALLERLERGDIPRGPVTLNESEQVIAMAGAERGIKSIRSHADLQRDATGEVAATSTHHVLLALSGGVGVRIEKQRLDRAMTLGETVTIQYGADRSKVLEVGDAKARVIGRDQGSDFSR